MPKNPKNAFEFARALKNKGPQSPIEIIIDKKILAETIASKERIRARLEVLAARFAGPIAPFPPGSSEELVGDDKDGRPLVLAESD